MGTARKEEERALDDDERDLVAKTRQPKLRELSDAALHELVRFVRERRDKAKTLDYRHRREMRGRPVTASPQSEGLGSRRKVAVLASAMRRLNDETERRDASADRKPDVSRQGAAA